MNNQHQNARTTFHSRVLMVERVKEQKMSPRQVAERLGVNVSTVYKWLRRFAKGGEAALRDRSSRPHRSPRRLGWSGWPPSPPCAGCVWVHRRWRLAFPGRFPR